MQVFKSLDPDYARQRFEYDPATGHLIWKPARCSRVAGKVAGHRHTCTVGKTYIQVRVDDVLHYAHRIVWVMMRGPIPPGMQVDHINGDGADNRLENLRCVTASENKRNQRRLVNNTSGFTGVYRSGKRFMARVWVSGQFLSLGSADTAEQAYEIRQAFNRENGFHENHGSDRPL